MLLSAASSTLAAMTTSTHFDCGVTQPSAASVRVIVCDTVNAVTMPSTCMNAVRRVGAGSHFWRIRISAAGSSSEIRNARWS